MEIEKSQVEKSTQLEFKVGRLHLDPDTKVVTPDKSRGLLRLKKSDEEKHLSWINLDTNKQQIELIIFENDAHFQILPKRKNVFVLWFESFEDRYFFWLQETGAKIEDVERKIQAFINSIDEEPQPSSAQNKEAPVENQSKPAPKPVSKPTGQQGIDLSMFSELQKKLEASIKKSSHEAEPMVLSEVLNKDFLKWCADNYDEKFLKHLPEGQQTPEGFKDNIHSPQLLQAIDALGEALNTEGILALFHQMGLDPQFLHQYHGAQAFLKALDKWGKQHPGN